MWQETKNIYHFFQAVLASIFFGFPANDMVVIGVTGTDGKTTTANLIFHILKRAGHKTAIISTVSAIIGDREFDTGFHVSTPDPFILQSYLRKAKKSGVTHVVLEITSHALDQYRVWGIPIAVGVLTNVTHEHLDYHKTYEQYLKTKLRLLQIADVAVVNRDDESYDSIKYKVSSIKGKLATYGLENGDVNREVFPFKTHLIGDYNKYNILAAVAACQNLGIDDADIKKAIADFIPPVGRAEIVHENDFTVMIDFAHTPNSLQNILQAVRSELSNGRLVHVFGAAGERDKRKRPEMGRVSSEYADVIILTAEDPRSESVKSIMSQIEAGFVKVSPSKAKPYKIPDRHEAIEQAIKMAKKGDFVVITGKGHERSMNFGNGEVPWSDHSAVEKALNLRNK